MPKRLTPFRRPLEDVTADFRQDLGSEMLTKQFHYKMGRSWLVDGHLGSNMLQWRAWESAIRGAANQGGSPPGKLHLCFTGRVEGLLYMGPSYKESPHDMRF